MKTQITNVTKIAYINHLTKVASLAALLLLLCVGSSAWGQPAQGSVLSGTSPNGGTVTITITLQNGTVQRFRVKVDPGESSALVMQALAKKIDSSTSFSALATSFTIGGTADPKQTVDSVKITSLAGAITAVRVYPDDTGFKQYGSSNGASNEQGFLLLPRGPILPGQVEFSAELGTSTSILAQADLLVSNGTSVGTILSGLSSQLAADGVNSQVFGDMLTVDTAAGQTFLIGGSPFSEGLTSIAYDQSIFGGLASPEPSSLLLLGSGVLGLSGLLRKRLLTRS